MQAGAICLGVNRDTRNVECAKGSKDAARYGAAIGDKDFLEHERWRMRGRAVPPRGKSMPRSSAAKRI
jgi:hypothetical protein